MAGWPDGRVRRRPTLPCEWETGDGRLPGPLYTGGVTETKLRAGSLPSAQEQTLAAKDKTLTSPAAVALARAALEGVAAADAVGEHEAAAPTGERLVTHLFACTMPGYRGWRWAVAVARPPRGRTATVCEIVLLPGEDALLAPAWVPWADRLEPGDVGRSDRLPFRETDERLEPGWEATGEEADAVALDELDLGRARVLSPEGVARAAQRWYGSDHGPDADGVRKAHATCSTCGFLMRMTGAMRGLFGVCANEWAADDGRVVSLDHGCGAHSETDLPDQGPEWPVTPSRVDGNDLEVLATDAASQVEATTGAGGAGSRARKATTRRPGPENEAPQESQGGSQPTDPAPENLEPSEPSAQPGTGETRTAVPPARPTTRPHEEPADGPEDGGAHDGGAHDGDAHDGGAHDGPSAAGHGADAVGPEDVAGRAASARDAVVDLTRHARYRPTEHHAPATLEELEAILPTGH